MTTRYIPALLALMVGGGAAAQDCATWGSLADHSFGIAMESQKAECVTRSRSAALIYWQLKKVAPASCISAQMGKTLEKYGLGEADVQSAPADLPSCVRKFAGAPGLGGFGNTVGQGSIPPVLGAGSLGGGSHGGPGGSGVRGNGMPSKQ
jgi:hypothetical protein